VSYLAQIKSVNSPSLASAGMILVGVVKNMILMGCHVSIDKRYGLLTDVWL
jgi:hypothetical protein